MDSRISEIDKLTLKIHVDVTPYDISNLRVLQNECVGPNVSTTPLRQWGFRQCLPLS